MNDSFEGSLEETTAVVTELVAKARETRATGARVASSSPAPRNWLGLPRWGRRA